MTFYAASYNRALSEWDGSDRKYDFMEDKKLTRYNKNAQDVADKVEVPLRRNYEEFKLVVNKFTERFRLLDFDIKQIDQYLWQLGKDWFPNYYQMDKDKAAELKKILEDEKDHKNFYVDLANPDRVVYNPTEDSREISRERAALMKLQINNANKEVVI